MRASKGLHNTLKQRRSQGKSIEKASDQQWGSMMGDGIKAVIGSMNGQTKKVRLGEGVEKWEKLVVERLHD